MSRNTATTTSSDSEEEEEEIVACCVCNCSVDYADREAFFIDSSSDSKNEDLPLLLPTKLYDECNNIVFCDGCDRPYHQKCHFVPLLAIPRGDWYCLICTQSSDYKKKKNNKKSNPYQTLFPSPPPENNNNNNTLDDLQLQFEYTTRHEKATLWKKELSTKFKNVIQQQLQHVRHSQFTLNAYTSTHRARQFLHHGSQELSQSLVKLYSAQSKLRMQFESLQGILEGREQHNTVVLMEWIQQEAFSQETRQALLTKCFPYGTHHAVRTIPRLEQQQQHDENAEKDSSNTTSLPSEVVVTRNKSSTTATATTQQEDDDDDDDLISLDDLRCCVCFRGDATDENDLLLCDGCGCFRAYHQDCVVPRVSLEDAEEDDDWFCPLCQALADMLHYVETEYHHSRHGEAMDEDDALSVQSWQKVSDVFPKAQHHLEIAQLYKSGKHNAETDALVSSVLGIDNHEQTTDDNNSNMDESEDDDDDDDFDLKHFETEKKRDNDTDNSSVSTNATLQDMSSVEYEIDRTELDALSVGSEEEDASSKDDDQDDSRRRRTRSSRARANDSNDASSSSASSRQVDIGTLDESNIIEGKRNRRKVDYQRLNDSMFGWMNDDDAAKAFGDEQHDEFLQSTKATTKSNESSMAESSEEETNETNDESDSGSSSDNNDESSSSPPAVKTAKRKASSSKKSRGKAKKESSEDDESSASSPPAKKAKPSAPKKKSSSKKAPPPKRVAKGKAKKPTKDSSDDDESSASSPPAKKAKSTASKKKTSPKKAPPPKRGAKGKAKTDNDESSTNSPPAKAKNASKTTKSLRKALPPKRYARASRAAAKESSDEDSPPVAKKSTSSSRAKAAKKRSSSSSRHVQPPKRYEDSSGVDSDSSPKKPRAKMTNGVRAGRRKKN